MGSFGRPCRGSAGLSETTLTQFWHFALACVQTDLSCISQDSACSTGLLLHLLELSIELSIESSIELSIELSAAKTSVVFAAETYALSAAKTSALSAAKASALKTSASSHISMLKTTTCARLRRADVVVGGIEM